MPQYEFGRVASMLLSRQMPYVLFFCFLFVVSAAPGRSWAGGPCCGPAGRAVDRILSIPAEITAGLAGAPCGEYCARTGNLRISRGRCCGPVGRGVEWALSLPGAVLGALAGAPCRGDSFSYRFPAGCATCIYPGGMPDIGPWHTVEDSPRYVTYGVVETRTVRTAPPVVVFSRPLGFSD